MKLVLLFSFLSGGVEAQVLVSSDRFLLKILDRTISLQDFHFHLRNIKALNCIYPDAMIIQYLGKKYLQGLEQFLEAFPKEEDMAPKYMHQNAEILKKSRYFFKVLRYAADQKAQVSPGLEKLIQEGVKANGCDSGILHKETLKTNFINLLQMELYFRSRYGAQLKGNKSFQTIRLSVDLFVESLDKQFQHEYYW